MLPLLGLVLTIIDSHELRDIKTGLERVQDAMSGELLLWQKHRGHLRVLTN